MLKKEHQTNKKQNKTKKPTLKIRIVKNGKWRQNQETEEVRQVRNTCRGFGMIPKIIVFIFLASRMASAGSICVLS